MTTAGLQREIDFGPGTGRPLVPIEAVMVILDRNEDDLLRLVEEGELEFAFDISSAGAARREVRIYRESLLRYRAQSFRASLAPVRSDIPAQESRGLLHCITAILPQHSNMILTAVELARCWSCSSSHVQRLIADGALADASPEGRKLTNTRSVTCASAEAFLTRRRIA